MRTTIDLDEDILGLVKQLAVERKESLGKVLSTLARLSLSREATAPVRDGIRLLKPLPGKVSVSLVEINGLRELP
ncbi:MAG: CopG family transcriptional regulator [Acidobacteria bacterium]|nr:CopG family transcriptional regulator [Acidobacteriota bacterium]